MIRRFIYLVVGLGLLFAAGCGSPKEPPQFYRQPEQTKDGWETAQPESLGVAMAKIETMLAYLAEDVPPDLHSVLVVKDQQLIVEAYYNGYSRSRLQGVASVTKSVVSTLIGIAIEQGAIEGTGQRVADFFPEFAADFGADPRKENLRVWHLLTMTSGFDWDEETYPYGDNQNDATAMRNSGDPVGFVLSRPVVYEPGTHFQYVGANTMLLSVILERATGMTTAEFARVYLFDPLGISGFQWGKYRGGSVDADGGLSLRPRDMAKIGQLFMNGGIWDGRQLVPADWVAESTRMHTPAYNQVDYGYQWWVAALPHDLEKLDAFVASGFGGQKIYGFRDLGMVVVFTHSFDNPSQAEETNGKLLGGYLLPAAAPAGKAVWMAWTWAGIVASSLGVLAYGLRRDRLVSRLHGLVWVLAVVLVGPLGLVGYWVVQRQGPDAAPAAWRQAVGSAFCCTTGNLVGVMVLMAVVILFRFSGGMGLLGVLVPFLVGWLFFRAPLRARVLGEGAFQALHRTGLVEWITTSFVLAGVLPVFNILTVRWFAGGLDPFRPQFAFVMPLAAAAGLILVYPFTFWQARQKLLPAAVKVQDIPERYIISAPQPRLGQLWLPLLVGMAVFVGCMSAMLAYLSG